MLIGCGRQGLELISTSIGAGLNILLIMLLYPRFGLAGAALTMLISELVIGALAYRFVNCSIVSIDIWQHLRQPAIVALALALSMYLTAANPLWLQLCIALALFVAGVRLFDPQMFTVFQAILTARPAGESRVTS
jgi:O-antigen/teichoic acid export membrane protein